MNARRVIAALAAGAALATAAPHAPRADITGLPPAGVGMRRGDAPADTTPTGEITGVVRDGYDGRPVPFANVIVAGTKIGTMTSEAGAFRIKGVPVGPRKLLVAAIGYERAQRDLVVLARGVVDVQVQLVGPGRSAPTVAFEQPDEAVLDIVRHARRVHVYRLDVSRGPILSDIPGQAPTPHGKSLVAWPIAGEVTPGRRWLRDVQRLIGERASYRRKPDLIERCVPTPEFGVRFMAKKDFVDVVVDSNCARVSFRSTVGPSSRGTLAEMTSLRSLLDRLRASAGRD